MRTNKIDCSFCVSAPFDQPDRNGVIYTREAVSNALRDMPSGLPIIAANDCQCEEIVGTTTSKPYAVEFDGEKQICRYTIDGVIFFGGTTCLAKVEDGIIRSSHITGFGIST